MRINVDNVSTSLERNEILKGVSLNNENKPIVGIIGPNGSGKSTLLKCIYRVLEPKEGSIYFDGIDLRKIKVRESAKKVAVVAQHNDYSFDFTVLEVVLMGRAPHKKALERDNANDYALAEEALKKVGMLAFKNRNFSTLSGGEKQRVVLARALAQETKCLILDEPTNHLDITYQISLMKLVRELDVSVISAIHDLNIAAAYCDYLYILSNGEVVSEGKPEEILTEQILFDVYQVKAERVRDSKGKLHILYV